MGIWKCFLFSQLMITVKMAAVDFNKALQIICCYVTRRFATIMLCWKSYSNCLLGNCLFWVLYFCFRYYSLVTHARISEILQITNHSKNYSRWETECCVFLHKKKLSKLNMCNTWTLWCHFSLSLSLFLSFVLCLSCSEIKILIFSSWWI